MRTTKKAENKNVPKDNFRWNHKTAFERVENKTKANRKGQKEV